MPCLGDASGLNAHATRKCQLSTVLQNRSTSGHYEDALKYDLYILALTETHIKKEESTRITVSNDRNRKTYSVYHGRIKGENPYAGAGLIIEESLQPHFTRISDRIVKANFKINKDHQVNVIVAYAPTLIKSEKDPQIREDFYDELNKITLQYKKDKHVLLVLRDFNAKTGSSHSIYPENVGKFGKGHLNSNGEWLLDYAKENGLVLTNTLINTN